jgi:hypothetical protein
MLKTSEYWEIEDEPSGVHVLYHSRHWQICWYLFKKGYRSYTIKFKRYDTLWVDYCFWVSFGIGTLSIAFRPK